MTDDTGPDMTLEQFAELTGRNVDTIRRLARKGELAGAYQLGTQWRIPQVAADKLRGLDTTDEHEPDQQS